MKTAIFTDGSFGYSAIEEAIEYFSAAFKYDVVAVITITRLPWEEINGVPVYTSDTISECLDETLVEVDISAVLDITSYHITDKFVYANAIVNKGLAVYGADYRIFPPQKIDVNSPGTIAVLGDLNFGKTAVVAYIKKIGAEYSSIASVASDPRAPRYSIIVEPDKIRDGHDYSGLLAEHKAGRIINLYHYAVALTANIPSCSSTFAGIGFSGVPYASLDTDGVLYASGYKPDLIVMLSDKSVVPRVSFDGAILIIDSSTDPAEMEMYPYLYKLQNADLIILLSPRGAGGKRANRLKTRITEIFPDSDIFKAVENPYLLNKPEVTGAFLVYSERKDIVAATRTFIEKTYSIKINGVIDNSTPIPKKSELRKNTKNGKSCFILDLFDDNFAEWLEALTKADIPVAVLSRGLAPSPKKAFDVALKSLMKEAYITGQKRLAAAKTKAEGDAFSEEAKDEGTEGEAEEDDTEIAGEISNG